MIKKFRQYNEGKREQEKIDELLDKGLKNLTQREKDLLDKLSKGGSMDDEPKKGPNEHGVRMRGNIVKGGDDQRDFLNNLVGANLGDENTQFYQVMPDDTPFENPYSKLKSKFKDGDKITYFRAGSENNGKSGIFLNIREDGKYSIRFDDGKRFASNAKNIYPFKEKSDDDWNDDNDDDNNDDYNYSMINKHNLPTDFYFHVGSYDNIIAVTLTSINYYHQNGCVDDSLGSHNISKEVKDAMNRAGVFSEVEMMESSWEGKPGFTEDQIRVNMTAEGFNLDADFNAFLDGHQ